MLLGAIVISILVGLVRGGKIRNIEKIPLRYFYLFIASISIYLVAGIVAVQHGHIELVRLARHANIVQYTGLLVAIGLNLKEIREMWLVGVGTLCNFLVVAANGGVMPMSPNAIRAAGLPELLDQHNLYHMVRHSLMTSQSHFRPLGDIIPIGPFSFLPLWVADALKEVASIGDVLVSLAIFILIQRFMCHMPKVSKESTP